MTVSDRTPNLKSPCRPAGRRWRSRPKAIGETVSRLTRRMFARRGLADGTIVRDWRLIAGDALAERSAPQRIVYPINAKGGGTLHLRVADGAMATEIQHLEPILLERINTYFGFSAIVKLKIIQAPLIEPPAAGKPVLRPLKAAEELALHRRLADVDDQQLHDALGGLGRALISRFDDKDE
ncbi:MAG TPA: DUF721 domain-containing protein [Alphaproteobacteria bacterium]|nr:DUF721 domain-containing protein [Alphaproteobacteria bacterium]